MRYIMADISKQEEQILLAVWRLDKEAYGVPIRNFLKEVTGQNISIGGIYVPLDRLVRKGFLTATQSDPRPERGGMSRRYYKLTPDGLKTLQDAKKVHETLWENLPEISVKTS